ncbi:MAG: type III pantothenate kinase [Armatimonadaceae bacterium]
MLLTLDVGNTNTTIGLFDGADLVADFRLRSVRDRTGDEYAALIASLLLSRGKTLKDVSGVAMAYVVPPVGNSLRDLSRNYLDTEPLIVTSQTDLGLIIQYEPPIAVGADRVVNAFAARELYRGEDGMACPAVIVDYGTATTLDAVTAEGVYLGGALLPGIGISMDALFSHAALLSRVELTAPPAAIGQNTADALRSGILLGFAAQTDGMVERFVAEMTRTDPRPPRIIGTGGIAPLIAPHSRTLQIVDVNLTLTGLRLAYERWQRSG